MEKLELLTDNFKDFKAAFSRQENLRGYTSFDRKIKFFKDEEYCWCWFIPNQSLLNNDAKPQSNFQQFGFKTLRDATQYVQGCYPGVQTKPLKLGEKISFAYKNIVVFQDPKTPGWTASYKSKRLKHIDGNKIVCKTSKQTIETLWAIHCDQGVWF